MSVIPLSQKEAIESIDAPDGTVPYGSGTSEVKVDKSSDEKFDKIFEQAWAKLGPEIERTRGRSRAGVSMRSSRKTSTVPKQPRATTSHSKQGSRL